MAIADGTRRPIARSVSSARLLAPAVLAEKVIPLLDFGRAEGFVDISRDGSVHARFASVRGTAQHRLQILDLVAAAEPDWVGLLRADQAGLESATGLLAGEYMPGIEATVHLPGRVQLARWSANRSGNRPAPLFGWAVLERQSGAQVLPTAQGMGQEDHLALSVDRPLGEERRLQDGNAQRPVVLDVAELADKGQLTQRMVRAAGQVVALALQVVGGVTQAEVVGATPTTPLGIRLARGIRLQDPQDIEAVQMVTLEQVAVLRSDENAYSHSSKKATTWRIRSLSGSFRYRRR